MKNKFWALILMGTISLSLTACGNNASLISQQIPDAEPATTETIEDTEVARSAMPETAEDNTEATSIANPWRDCTEEEAYQYGPNGFSAPEGAANVQWSIMEVADNTTLPGTMIQLTYELDGVSYTAREQAVADMEIVDISGAYYDWTVEDEGTLQNWGGGNMACKTMRYIGDDEYVDVCLWFDSETGYAYSLMAVAKDLDGFDIQAAAAGIYDPAKQIGANAPDSSAETNELSNGFIENAAKEVSPSIDITGCDTFTQIVDQKLENGMGYANVTVTGTDLLLVSSATYDDLEGRMAAIDATAFEYKDGVVVEIGALCSGGTAYPFTMNNGYLYSGSNHWICKYAVANDKLSIMEKAGVIYDENGNGTYFYESDDGGDYSNMDSAEAEKIYNELIDEMMSGEIVNFQPVTK